MRKSRKKHLALLTLPSSQFKKQNYNRTRGPFPQVCWGEQGVLWQQHLSLRPYPAARFPFSLSGAGLGLPQWWGEGGGGRALPSTTLISGPAAGWVKGLEHLQQERLWGQQVLGEADRHLGPLLGAHGHPGLCCDSVSWSV